MPRFGSWPRCTLTGGLVTIWVVTKVPNFFSAVEIQPKIRSADRLVVLGVPALGPPGSGLCRSVAEPQRLLSTSFCRVWIRLECLDAD